MTTNTNTQDVQEITIVAEELQEDQVNVSDCSSTASTASTGGSCWGSISSMGSIVSCGENQLRQCKGWCVYGWRYQSIPQCIRTSFYQINFYRRNIMTDKIEKLAKAKVDDYEINTDIVAEEVSDSI